MLSFKNMIIKHNPEFKNKIDNDLNQQLYNAAYYNTVLCDSIKNIQNDIKFKFYKNHNNYKILGPDVNSCVTFTDGNKTNTIQFCKNANCSNAHRLEDIITPLCITQIITGSCNIPDCSCRHNIPVNIYENIQVCPKMEYYINNILQLTFKFYIDNIVIIYPDGHEYRIDIGSELLKQTNTNNRIIYQSLIRKIYDILTMNILELDNLIVQSDNNLKIILGNILYGRLLKYVDVIHKSEYKYENIIGKITGMYLETDIDYIINIIHDSIKNPENIKKIINEALDELNTSKTIFGNILYNLFLKEYDVIIHISKYKYKDIIGKITGMYLEYDTCDIINIINDSFNNPENIKNLINEALYVLNECEPNEDELLKK